MIGKETLAVASELLTKLVALRPATHISQYVIRQGAGAKTYLGAGALVITLEHTGMVSKAIPEMLIEHPVPKGSWNVVAGVITGTEDIYPPSETPIMQASSILGQLEFVEKSEAFFDLYYFRKVKANDIIITDSSGMYAVDNDTHQANWISLPVDTGKLLFSNGIVNDLAIRTILKYDEEASVAIEVTLDKHMVLLAIRSEKLHMTVRTICERFTNKENVWFVLGDKYYKIDATGTDVYYEELTEGKKEDMLQKKMTLDDVKAVVEPKEEIKVEEVAADKPTAEDVTAEARLEIAIPGVVTEPDTVESTDTAVIAEETVDPIEAIFGVVDTIDGVLVTLKTGIKALKSSAKQLKKNLKAQVTADPEETAILREKFARLKRTLKDLAE